MPEFTEWVVAAGQCLRGRRAQYISQMPAISSTAASPSGAAGLAPVLASEPDENGWLCRATGTIVSTAAERLSLADRNDCEVLATVEGGDVAVGTVELGADEDSAADELDAGELDADELGAAELDADELGAGELDAEALEPGDGQVAVGKNWPRAAPPACTSTCTKHLPATAWSRGSVT